jgi:hypothetical protein
LIDNDTAGALARRIAGGEHFDLVVLTESAISQLGRDGKLAPGATKLSGRVGIGVAVKRGAALPDIGSVDAFQRTLQGARGGLHRPASRRLERRLSCPAVRQARHCAADQSQGGAGARRPALALLSLLLGQLESLLPPQHSEQTVTSSVHIAAVPGAVFDGLATRFVNKSRLKAYGDLWGHLVLNDFHRAIMGWMKSRSERRPA